MVQQLAVARPQRVVPPASALRRVVRRGSASALPQWLQAASQPAGEGLPAACSAGVGVVSLGAGAAAVADCGVSGATGMAGATGVAAGSGVAGCVSAWGCEAG